MIFYAKLTALSVLLSAALLSSSCTLERLFPEDVADGVARLSVNNFGKLILAVNNIAPNDSRPECNFRSREVGVNTEIKADENGRGTVTWTFKNCEFDFGKAGKTVDSSNSCGPNTSTFYGKVWLSGTRSISGILTGFQENPVIPAGDATAEFKFARVKFQNYRVESSGMDKAMTNANGSAAFDATIHLAKSNESGLCEIALPNISLTNIRYAPEPEPEESVVRLPGPFGVFQATVGGSDFQAQVGEHQGLENHLSGSLMVWGSTYKVPSDGPRLDPDFSRKAYDDSLACTPHLSTPITGQCSFESELAAGVARLTVLNLGKLMQGIGQIESIDKRPECRITAFEKHPAQQVRAESGAIGEALWEFTQCEYDFGEGTELKLNPEDEAPTTFSGRVTLTGQRRVKGYMTGNNDMPVIPGQGAIEFSFSEMAFEHFKVKALGLDKSLTMDTGSLAFDMDIYLGKDHENEMCSVSLPNPTFRNIQYLERSTLLIPSENGDFKAIVDHSQIHAQVGTHGDFTNHLEGALILFGNEVAIGADDRKLDPDFDVNKAVQLEECTSFEPLEAELAGGVSRLSVKNVALLMSQIAEMSSVDHRKECMLIDLSFTEFNQCEYRFDNLDVSTPTGRALYNGRVVISGKKRVKGSETGWSYMPILPDKDGITFEIHEAIFDNFIVQTSTNGEKDHALKMVSAKMSFEIQIHLAKSIETQLSSVPVPNPTIRNLRYEKGARLVLPAPKIGDFAIEVNGSDLHAQIGPYGALENYISGSIVLFGTKVTLSDNKLDPGYDAARFLESVKADDPDLALPITYDSLDFDSFLALTAARLMVLNIGTITQESALEDLKQDRLMGCGFSSTFTRLKPESTTGNPGSQGSMVFSIKNCKVIDQAHEAGRDTDHCSHSTDHKTTMVEGTVTVSGTQTISGLRETRYGFVPSIVPNSPKSMSMNLTKIKPVNYSAYYVSDFTPVPKAKLTLESGTLWAKIEPVLAEIKDKPCEFARSTPIIQMEIGTKTPVNANIMLNMGNNTFTRHFVIEDLHLEAFNGKYQGHGNYLKVTMKLNGKAYQFDEPLTPNYSQDAFDQDYACRTQLPESDDYSIRAIIPATPGWEPNCPR